MGVRILLNRFDQRWNTLEYAATDGLVGDVAEPAFDHVEPRRTRRDKVQVKARVPLEPAFHHGTFVRQDRDGVAASMANVGPAPLIGGKGPFLVLAYPRR